MFSPLFNHYLIDRQRATLTVSQRDSSEWAALTANDPDKLFTMRAAYRRVTSAATPEDQEVLSEFYYRHFEITGETLAILRESRPDVYEKVGAKLLRLEGIEYLSAEAFEARLAENDMLRKDDLHATVEHCLRSAA